VLNGLDSLPGNSANCTPRLPVTEQECVEDHSLSGVAMTWTSAIRTARGELDVTRSDHCTTIVPTIPGWNVHLYVKVPLDCSVVLDMLPGAIEPESKTPVVSDVAVCAIESALVQVIVVPAETVTGLGTYPPVPSERAPTGIVTVTPIVDGDDGDDELPQPAETAARMTNETIGNATERIMEPLRRQQAGDDDHRKFLAVRIPGVFGR
jgi:hypothetical protein